MKSTEIDVLIVELVIRIRNLLGLNFPRFFIQVEKREWHLEKPELYLQNPELYLEKPELYLEKPEW